MEKIATDTFSFERIRQNGFVYVDKTAILKLLADGSLGSQFFIKPLLGHLGKPDVCEIRDALKEFYSVIKTCEGLQRFAFITGVSKVSKVSIFSVLNNLNEFSMGARVGTLFGYTHVRGVLDEPRERRNPLKRPETVSVAEFGCRNLD